MDERYYAEYFRVAFYGNFPVALRNKQFIVCVMVSLGLWVRSNIPTSTVGSSGRNSAHFVNGCSTSIPELSCSEVRAKLLSISVSERINTSSALQ